MIKWNISWPRGCRWSIMKFKEPTLKMINGAFNLAYPTVDLHCLSLDHLGFPNQSHFHQLCNTHARNIYWKINYMYTCMFPKKTNPNPNRQRESSGLFSFLFCFLEYWKGYPRLEYYLFLLVDIILSNCCILELDEESKANGVSLFPSVWVAYLWTS